MSHTFSRLCAQSSSSGRTREPFFFRWDCLLGLAGVGGEVNHEASVGGAVPPSSTSDDDDTLEPQHTTPDTHIHARHGI